MAITNSAGKEIQTAEFYTDMQTVMALFLRGETNYTEISRQTGIPRTQVVRIYNYWKDVTVNSPDVKDKAKELLFGMVESYDDIIKEFWSLKEDADNNGDRRTANAVLKNIADVQKSRLDAIQKAGLNFDAELENKLATMQGQSTALQAFLKEFAQSHPEIRTELLEGLSAVFSVPGQTTVVMMDAPDE